MCEKCDEIDRGIGHLRRMIEHLEDPGTIAAANKLIEEVEARKDSHFNRSAQRTV